MQDMDPNRLRVAESLPNFTLTAGFRMGYIGFRGLGFRRYVIRWYIGIMEKKWKPLFGVEGTMEKKNGSCCLGFRGYIIKGCVGIMEKKMEATVKGLGIKVHSTGKNEFCKKSE